ncbi:polyprenyl diphosphate synthase, partial [uncultured Muribaculum sp.]
MSRNHNIDPKRLPRHVAIIMDGNGRWARARGLDRSEGHVEGVNTVRKITEAASEIGIKYLTLYTFSTENWNRPQEEVDALMNLIVIAIERETADLIKNNVRLTMIGDFGRMPDFARRRLSKCMDDTAQCTGLTLVLALSYSSRWEITEAVRNIAAKVQAGSLDPDDITDD